MIDDDGVSRITDSAGAEGHAARLEPFVEYFCLEQRSREVRKDEARIGFARPKPTTHDAEDNLVWNRKTLFQCTLGGLAGGRAARNLLSYHFNRRDVLKIQRTGSFSQG